MKRIFVISTALLALVVLSWVDSATVDGARTEHTPKGKLALTIAPPVLPADGASHPVIYVQLLRSDGSPVLAVEDTEISLISSDARIGKVPRSVSIPTGRSFAVATISTTAIPGKITLTSVSLEWEMATAEVTTFDTLLAARPFRVTLHAAPPKMIVGASPPGLLSVVLQGTNGIPLLTDRDLVVHLEVSSPNVVEVASTATIPANSYFTTTTIKPSATGTAVLTAVSAGFVSEFMAVHVVEPGDVASSLSVYVSPPILRSGIEAQPSIIVQAQDDRGTPVPFPCQGVKLSSSYPSSANASSPLLVSCDTSQQFAVAGLEVGTVPGTPTIVVAGTGMTPASTGVTVHGQTPAKLKLYTAPRAPLAIDSVPGYLVVQLVDHNDVPVTLHRGIQVSFQGTNIVSTDRAFIPPGDSFTRVELIKPETFLPKTTIWSIGDALASAQASVEIHSVSMTILIDESDGPAFIDQPVAVSITVNSAGAPVGQAEITWSTDTGKFIHAALYTGERGEAHATYLGNDVGNVTIDVTAKKPGFTPADAQVEIPIVQPPRSTSDQPTFWGVPVPVLFGLVLISLVGYGAMSVRQTLKMRLGKLFRRDSIDITKP